MSSFSLPGVDLVVVTVMAACVLALAVAAGYLLWQLRIVVPKRLKLMEDALRVYNSANATLGCRITELESALQQVRHAPPAQPVEAAPPPLRIVQSAAERYESRANSTVAAPANRAAAPAAIQPKPTPPRAAAGSEFTEAELKLAQLIKSRLGSLRVG